MPGPIALTGATGFIGSRLLAALNNKRFKVRALTRTPRRDNELTQWITGDLQDRAALQALVRDASAVVHCAGIVRGFTEEQFIHANVDGTANLLNTCSSVAPSARFLLISSLAAREPHLSWYARSKRLAEEKVQQQGNLAWTIFRPTAIYGPGDREMKPLFRATRLGVLPMIGPPGNRFSLLFVDDLVAAIMHWVAAAEPVTGVFELDDGTRGGYDFAAIARIAGQVWQRPVRTIPVPSGLVSALARVNLALAGLFRYAPMLTPGKTREIFHPDWRCDNAPLEKALPAWRPSVTLAEGLPLSV